MTAPILNDWQGYFEANGSSVRFGQNTDVGWEMFSGASELTVLSGDQEAPRDDGGIPGDDFQSMKTIILDLETLTTDAEAELVSAFSIHSAQGELHWKRPNHPQRFIRCKAHKRSDDQGPLTSNLLPLTVALQAVDPRIYHSGTKESMTIGVFDISGGGTEWEIDWELDWGAITGSTVVCNNEGDSFAYPTVTFFGPIVGTCTGVLLTNMTTGQVLDINRAISTGQLLVADMDNYIRKLPSPPVIRIGSTSFYGDWQTPREPFRLQPGNNILKLEVDGTSTDVIANIQWRHTSMS